MHLDQRSPDILWLVRHGESAGNVAREAAEADGRTSVGTTVRDIDIPLSARGEAQASALGAWFGRMAPDLRPNVVLTSPYLRAMRTAELLVEHAKLDAHNTEVVIDERLREREFGILDGLTRVGVLQKYPEQYELKQEIGKFYHRPPGGESWCDVLLRLRSVVDSLSREYRRMRVLLVGHAVVVMCFRYLLDQMSESDILAIDKADDVANCSLTTYCYDPTRGPSGRLVLHEFNVTKPLEDASVPVTVLKDGPGPSK